MQFALVVLIWIAVYAGYKEWSLYTILPVSGALVVWNLMYFGAKKMHIATGGPAAYLLRISIFNIVQATAFYTVGFGLFHLIG
jgi:hypothetical protein